MFLTRGKLHHEATWEMWFKRAEGALPVQAVREAGCTAANARRLQRICGAAAGPTAMQRQHLFNVYIHVGSNEKKFRGASGLPQLRSGFKGTSAAILAFHSQVVHDTVWFTDKGCAQFCQVCVCMRIWSHLGVRHNPSYTQAFRRTASSMGGILWSVWQCSGAPFRW